MIYTTNFGEALYPYLTIPDMKFDPQGKYHVKLKVKSDEAQTEYGEHRRGEHQTDNRP